MHAASVCAVCEGAVRGVYVACPGCGHGGHLDHMTAWFARHTQCPSGCGHRCTGLVPTNQ